MEAARSAIVIRLNSPVELFEVAAKDLFCEGGRCVSGIDELVQEVSYRPTDAHLRAIFVLPMGQIEAGTEARFRQGIERYCTLRQRQNEAERRTGWRDVLGSFAIGIVLFALGFALSFYFSQAHLPALMKSLFGDGIFLVIAWVGLWYPLDELVHYRRRLIREQKVLAAIRKIDISLRADLI
jgi:hypothetical protein